MEAYTPAFCGAVLDSLSFELKRSKDFSKLYAGIAILGYVAAVQEPINKRAFSQLPVVVPASSAIVSSACADLGIQWPASTLKAGLP